MEFRVKLPLQTVLLEMLENTVMKKDLMLLREIDLQDSTVFLEVHSKLQLLMMEAINMEGVPLAIIEQQPLLLLQLVLPENTLQ